MVTLGDYKPVLATEWSLARQLNHSQYSIIIFLLYSYCILLYRHGNHFSGIAVKCHVWSSSRNIAILNLKSMCWQSSVFSPLFSSKGKLYIGSALKHTSEASHPHSRNHDTEEQAVFERAYRNQANKSQGLGVKRAHSERLHIFDGCSFFSS